MLLINDRFEFLYQVVNWCYFTTTRFLHWKIPGFRPYIGLNSCIKTSFDLFFSEMFFLSQLLYVQSISFAPFVPYWQILSTTTPNMHICLLKSSLDYIVLYVVPKSKKKSDYRGRMAVLWFSVQFWTFYLIISSVNWQFFPYRKFWKKNTVTWTLDKPMAVFECCKNSVFWPEDRRENQSWRNWILKVFFSSQRVFFWENYFSTLFNPLNLSCSVVWEAKRFFVISIFNNWCFRRFQHFEALWLLGAFGHKLVFWHHWTAHLWFSKIQIDVWNTFFCSH